MEKAQFIELARKFAAELLRYGLRPRALTEENVEDDGEGTLSVSAASWRRDRPEIWVHRGNHPGAGKFDWFGFATDKDGVKQFMENQIASEFDGIKITSDDVDEEGKYRPHALKELNKCQGVAYELLDNYYYFGKYYSPYLGNYVDQDNVVVKAAQFVGEIVQSIDPELSAQRDIAELEKIKKDDPTTYETLVKARRGQGEFRRRVEEKWDFKCAILKCGSREVLRASHIKPWAASNGENQNKERLDGNNGLLLTATLDALFDKGLITFEETGEIRLSRTLSPEDLSILKLDELKLAKSLNLEQKTYLEYHRKHVFRE